LHNVIPYLTLLIQVSNWGVYRIFESAGDGKVVAFQSFLDVQSD